MSRFPSSAQRTLKVWLWNKLGSDFSYLSLFRAVGELFIPYFGTVCVADFCYYKNPVKWIILCCFFVQCLLLYFASADYRKWMSWKKWLTSTYFQYISAITLFWFWPQPIRRHETDILPMVMAQTVCGLLHAYGNLKEKGNGSFKMFRIVEKPRELYIGTKKKYNTTI